MIAIISMLDREKGGTSVSCAITTSKIEIVSEIYGVLKSIYDQRPEEFLEACNTMLENMKESK